MVRKSAGAWFVYILECANGRLYTGITTDVEKRFAKHVSGKGAMFTRLNRPAKIIAVKLCANRSEASKLEYAVKQMTPKQKHAAALGWV
jgi:putative endonuclease